MAYPGRSANKLKKKSRQARLQDLVELAEVSRSHSTFRVINLEERAEHIRQGYVVMSSNKTRRKQKTSKEGSSLKKVVNTLGSMRVRSVKSARNENDIFQGQSNCLMEKIVEKANIKRALRRVKLNRGAPGVDGVRVEELKSYLIENWESVRNQLLSGTYFPMPVRRVEIPKSSCGTRKLGIPSVLDRLIQQAILQIINECYDKTFSNYSFGFRPKCSAKQAIKLAQVYIRSGYKFVVDMDLENFFDKVNHDKLMGKLAKDIQDKRLLLLIRRYLNAGIMLNGCRVRSEEGTPQGGPLSPLLSNIVLHELDEELENRGHKFVRYADDCNIYVRSKRAGERVMESIRKFVESDLKLKVNLKKSAVDRPWKRTFLGISFLWDYEKRIRISGENLRRFKRRIRQLTNKSWGISMEERLKKLKSYLIGWINYFRMIQTPSVFETLDGWIRRRLRACFLKQWKKPKTVKRNLIKLGLTIDKAARIAYSRKGTWRLSITQQIHYVLGLKFWDKIGLISLRKRYFDFVEI